MDTWGMRLQGTSEDTTEAVPCPGLLEELLRAIGLVPGCMYVCMVSWWFDGLKVFVAGDEGSKRDLIGTCCGFAVGADYEGERCVYAGKGRGSSELGRCNDGQRLKSTKANCVIHIGAE